MSENEKNSDEISREYARQVNEIKNTLDIVIKRLEELEKSTKLDLDHQLFFGLVFSLLLVLFTFPTQSQLIDIFEKFITIEESVFLAQLFRWFLIFCLIFSSIFRYIGAVLKKTSFILYSIIFFIEGGIGVIHIILYKAIWIWLGGLHIITIPLLPIGLLFLSICVLKPFEIKWFNIYTNNIPNIIPSDTYIILNLWITLSIILSIYIPLFVKFTKEILNMSILISAILAIIIFYVYKK